MVNGLIAIPLRILWNYSTGHLEALPKPMKTMLLP